jgi:hypothetical protein
MNRSSFPAKREKLNLYFAVVIAYLILNATRLRISTDNLNNLNALYGDDQTDGTYLFIWEAWKDESGKRTKVISDSLKELETKIKKQLQDIYNDIPFSVWTAADRDILNRKTGAPRKRTTPRSPIVAKCNATLTDYGGGKIKVAVNIPDDSRRHSLAEGADGFEIAWRLDPPIVVAALAGADLSGKTKYYDIKDAGDGTIREVATKASIFLTLGSGKEGCRLQLYTRFINTKHRELDGPITGPVSIIIS